MTKTIKGQRLKRVAESAPVPKDLAGAASMVARIGAIQRELQLSATALSESIARIKEAAEAGAAQLKVEAEALTRGLQIWAEANREQGLSAATIEAIKKNILGVRQ